MHIRTDRAFVVQLTVTSWVEGEHGIPFVINPTEVVGIEFNYWDRKGATRLELRWADDYRLLTVHACGGPWDGECYTYCFDQIHQRYARV